MSPTRPTGSPAGTYCLSFRFRFLYGCRSLPGGTPANNEPCVRANNLNTGLAFEFQTTGTTGGTITAKPSDASKPFVTNATGVATGLNADRVDGRHAADIVKDAVLSKCALSATATGTAPGYATVTPTVAADKKSTTVDVRMSTLRARPPTADLICTPSAEQRWLRGATAPDVAVPPARPPSTCGDPAQRDARRWRPVVESTI